MTISFTDQESIIIFKEFLFLTPLRIITEDCNLTTTKIKLVQSICIPLKIQVVMITRVTKEVTTTDVKCNRCLVQTFNQIPCRTDDVWPKSKHLTNHVRHMREIFFCLKKSLKCHPVGTVIKKFFIEMKITLGNCRSTRINYLNIQRVHILQSKRILNIWFQSITKRINDNLVMNWKTIVISSVCSNTPQSGHLE